LGSWVGKRVFITGASSGIGRAVAEALVQRGAHVVGTARRAAVLDEVASGLSGADGSFLGIAGDSAVPEQAEGVLQQALDHLGGLDVVWLNAGGGAVLPVAETPAARIRSMMAANYDTVVNYLPLALPALEATGGCLAQTCSLASFMGLPNTGPYSAAKAASRTLFESLRIELAGRSVDVVTILPGFVYTPGLDPNDVPMKRLILPLDRAVREVIHALERRLATHAFPKGLYWLTRWGAMLPEGLRVWILGRVGGTPAAAEA